MSPLDNPFTSSTGKKATCLEMLQTILDGNASDEQQVYFKQHMEKCMPCYKAHELDMQIKHLLKSRCSGNHVPPDLLEKIKNQVNSIS